MLPQCDQRPILELFNERDQKDEPMEACRTCPRQDACKGHSCCFIGGKTDDLLLITLTEVISRAVRKFSWKRIWIWDGFGPIGNTEKNGL